MIHKVLTGDCGRWVDEDKEDVQEKKKEKPDFTNTGRTSVELVRF